MGWGHPTSVPKLTQALPPLALQQGPLSQAGLAASSLFPASFLSCWQVQQEWQGYGGVYGVTAVGAGGSDPTPKLQHGCEAQRVLHSREQPGFGLTPWPLSCHGHHLQC